MKKTYITPAMECIALETNTMLAASSMITVYSENFDPSNMDALSRQVDIFDDVIMNQ